MNDAVRNRSAIDGCEIRILAISADEAKRLLHKHRIEKLLVVDRGGALVGLITVKDILKGQDQPDAVKDAQGRLVNKTLATVFKDHGDAYVQDCAMK